MTKFRAGILALAVIGVFAYFGFTKANPFANPYQLNAVFDNVNNLKVRSPVRIAGVEVGKVKKVQPITSGEGAARVTMELKDKALPIHDDATAKVRSRIFLEGNFFIDIAPGSPTAPEMKDGDTIPIQRTAAPVQFGQLLSALQSDTREDLKSFLREYSKGLEGKGARGFNQSIKYWDAAYRNAALANDATLGVDPSRDIQRVLRGQARTFRALNADPEALKSLVTDFNITAGAFAREDAALEASIPALDAMLRTAQPALASLNDALPTLRAFSRDALPGVRSSDETLAASMPFITQARLLMRREELRGTAEELRRYIPSIVRLNQRSIGIARQGRALSRCTNEVLVPFMQSRIPDVDDHENTNQQVRFQIQRGLPGLSGESRMSDGNNQTFHGSAAKNPPNVQPVPPTIVDQPPPRRPDVPCETQQTPDLHAAKGSVVTSGNASEGPFPGQLAPFADLLPRKQPSFNGRALMEAGKLIKKAEQKQLAEQAKDAEEPEATGGDSR